MVIVMSVTAPQDTKTGIVTADIVTENIGETEIGIETGNATMEGDVRTDVTVGIDTTAVLESTKITRGAPLVLKTIGVEITVLVTKTIRLEVQAAVRHAKKLTLWLVGEVTVGVVNQAGMV